MKGIKSIVRQGKTSKGNLNLQFYISISFILGFVFLFIWIEFFFPRTFVDIKLILGILLIPGIFVTFLVGKKVLAICGYTFPIKNNSVYNVVISILNYMLITMPFGNTLVLLFFIGNNAFAQTKIVTVKDTSFHTGEKYYPKSDKKHTCVIVELFGVKKTINVGSRDFRDVVGSTLIVEASEGSFGYYILRHYKFE